MARTDERLTLHVGPETHRRARSAAEASGVTVGSWVEAAVRRVAALESALRVEDLRASSQVFTRFEEADHEFGWQSGER